MNEISILQKKGHYTRKLYNYTIHDKQDVCAREIDYLMLDQVPSQAKYEQTSLYVAVFVVVRSAGNNPVLERSCLYVLFVDVWYK